MNKNQEILHKFVDLFQWDDIELADLGIPLVEQYKTDDAELKDFYARIPVRFPALFEKLLLSYRWQRSCLDEIRLLANPPGPGLRKFEQEIRKDTFLAATILKEGFLQLGFASDSYDPLCFDTVGVTGKRWSIVLLDHEDILCRSKCGVKKLMFSSFRNLILNSIQENI